MPLEEAVYTVLQPRMLQLRRHRFEDGIRHRRKEQSVIVKQGSELAGECTAECVCVFMWRKADKVNKLHNPRMLNRTNLPHRLRNSLQDIFAVSMQSIMPNIPANKD